jgi:hypothetical protein
LAAASRILPDLDSAISAPPTWWPGAIRAKQQARVVVVDARSAELTKVAANAMQAGKIPALASIFH